MLQKIALIDFCVNQLFGKLVFLVVRQLLDQKEYLNDLKSAYAKIKYSIKRCSMQTAMQIKDNHGLNWKWEGIFFSHDHTEKWNGLKSRSIHRVPIVDKCRRTTILSLVALYEWAVFYKEISARNSAV